VTQSVTVAGDTDLSDATGDRQGGGDNNNNNNNNNNHDNVYGAVIRRSPGSYDECKLSAGWPPTLRPNQPIWAVSPPKDRSPHI